MRTVNKIKINHRFIIPVSSERDALTERMKSNNQTAQRRSNSKKKKRNEKISDVHVFSYFFNLDFDNP